MRWFGKIATAAAVLLVLPAAQARPQPLPQTGYRLVLDYDGSLLIKVLDVRIEQQMVPDGFVADAHIKTSGILALFKKIDVQATSQGPASGGTLAPATFRHENHDGADNRRVQVRWQDGEVTATAAPLWPNLGSPAPTLAQKRAAADPLTQLMRLSLASGPEGPCHGPVRMFDGRQLYEVTLAAPQSRVRTPAEARFGLVNPIRCSLTLTEVAGFDPKPANNRSQGLKMPLAVRFAETGEAGPWIITGLTGSTPLGDAHIDLRSLKAEG